MNKVKETSTSKTEENTTTKVEEQQSSSVTDETTEQITTEQPTTEQPTTEEETTAPKITQCQNISEIIGMDIFTLEGIDGPKPTEDKFGADVVFWYTAPDVCIWDKEEKAFVAVNMYIPTA